MITGDKLEKLMWSIALPGFGQILNGKLFKGILFVALEYLINIYSNLNSAIIYSFRGNIDEAVSQTNYKWLMFYPCIYVFAIWDAYREADGENTPYSFIPFVFAAYTGTIGVIFSSQLRIFRILLGPIWLPIIFLIFGSILGLLIKKVLFRLLPT